MNPEKIDTISINNVEYIRKDTISVQPKKEQGLPYCIVRTYSAGVFAGYVKEEKGQEIILINARRLWQWAGAASLSQFAEEGTSAPSSCKFPQEVSEIKLYQVIEKLNATEKCKKSIASVAIWKV